MGTPSADICMAITRSKSVIYTAHTHINIYVCIIMMATLLEPGPGGIRSTPQRGGASGFTWAHPVGDPLFDLYVEPPMLDSHLCIL